MSYAVKVHWGEDQWTYVIQSHTLQGKLQPILFSTRDEAQEMADLWTVNGKVSNVKVVEYEVSAHQ